MVPRRSAEYGLMVMSFLAANKNTGFLTASDIASKLGVSPTYTSKILRKLVLAKLLEAERGHGGGFKLTLHPERVRFLDIIEAIDGQFEEPCCKFNWSDCSPENPCMLHSLWLELSEQMMRWASKTTLADVLRDFDNYAHKT